MTRRGPWLAPTTQTTFICEQGRPHLIVGEVCTCKPRRTR